MPAGVGAKGKISSSDVIPASVDHASLSYRGIEKKKRCMMATGVMVFRVTGLPDNQPNDELAARLKSFTLENLREEERPGILPRIDLVPSCHEHDHGKTALMDFVAGVPQFLSLLIENPLGSYQMEMDDTVINFDRHFHGFTQLYATEPGQTVSAE